MNFHSTILLVIEKSQTHIQGVTKIFQLPNKTTYEKENEKPSSEKLLKIL